jgi:6-phosphogluconolactonase
VSGSPSFLAIDTARRHLYAVDETAVGQVRAFALDAAGALAPLNTVSSGGSSPVHLAVAPSGGWLLVANYGDGVVAVLPIRADGSLGGAVDTHVAGQNAHQVAIDASGSFVYVPCKGSDYVAEYAFDAQRGRLTPVLPNAASAPGAGPRHLALAPGGGFAYVVDENDNTMAGYLVDAGRLVMQQTVSTLPAGFSGTSRAAEVAVHPSGRLLFGSNRGDDSIVTYALDGVGHMTPVGFTRTGGATPRSFALDPSGRRLLVANQASNDVTVFTVDAAEGTLAPSSATVAAPMPAFVGVYALP